MRKLLHSTIGLMLALGAWSAPAAPADDAEASSDPDAAASLDTTADRFFGQSSFANYIGNSSGISASTECLPIGVALDAAGNLYVADTCNNRVLEYDAPLTSNRVADRVFGQPSFITNTANNGGISASSLSQPTGLALDAAGNLYVADFSNNRVLEYDAPLYTDRVADRVYGQPDFSHNLFNYDGQFDNPTARSLFGPTGVLIDKQGNLYVADTDNQRVLEYDKIEFPFSLIPTADRVFGQGGSFTTRIENRGGVSASSLSFPTGVALDVAGNLYVADQGNNRVLEYDAPLASRVADLVLGQPNFAGNTLNNGGVSASGLFSPYGVTLDAASNLYVADTYNNRVLEYDAPRTTNRVADRVFGQGGSFTTKTARKGGVSANSLFLPTGVALDPTGNLYVVDKDDSRVLEFDLPVPHGGPVLSSLAPSTVAAKSAGFVLTVNGTGFVPSSVVRWNGGSRPTTFINNTQLTAAISSTDIATSGPFPVTVFTPVPGGGTSAVVNLSLYTRVSQDTTADVVQGQPNFTSNLENNLLLPGPARLRAPIGLAVDAARGRLFVADAINNRVLSWPNLPAFANGQPADIVLGQPNGLTTGHNTGGLSARSLNSPEGVALDAAGNLYVADSSNHRVLEYDAPLSSGMAASRVFGQGGSFTTGTLNNGGVSANSLGSPQDLALDAAGNLYVADSGNSRVLEFDAPLITDQTADRVFGQPDFSHGTPNNGGVNAQSLSYPTGLAIDGAGNLFVADYINNRVLAYSAPLTTTGQAAALVLGQGGSFTTTTPNKGGVSSNPTAGSLNNPEDVALDVNDNLYVADYQNSRVLEFDQPLSTDDLADRVLGQGGSFTTGTTNKGGVSASSLGTASAVALDARSNVYVSDSYNSRVLEYAWVVPVTILDLPLVLRP